MELFARKRIQKRAGTKHEVSFSRQILRGVLRLVLITVLLTGLWYGTRLSVFTIRDVSVSGGETISHEFVKSEIEEELTGAYLLFVPKRFAYLYPHDRIIERLGKISRVHNLIVARTSRNALSVSFEEYMPYALWCSDTTDASCWFLSSDGYAFSPAPLLHGGTLMRHRIENEGEIIMGKVVSEESLRALDAFVAQASEELDLRITAIIHKKNGDIEFMVNGGGKILASSGRDLHTTYENLKSVLTAPEFKHLQPGNFQYVDVRFENKVFVNEESLEVATTSAELSE